MLGHYSVFYHSQLLWLAHDVCLTDELSVQRVDATTRPYTWGNANFLSHGQSQRAKLAGRVRDGREGITGWYYWC